MVVDVPTKSWARNWPNKGNKCVIVLDNFWTGDGLDIVKLILRGFGNGWPVTDKVICESTPSWYDAGKNLVYGVLMDPMSGLFKLLHVPS